MFNKIHIVKRSVKCKCKCIIKSFIIFNGTDGFVADWGDPFECIRQNQFAARDCDSMGSCCL